MDRMISGKRAAEYIKNKVNCILLEMAAARLEIVAFPERKKSNEKELTCSKYS